MKKVTSFILLAALMVCAILSALPAMAATPDGTALSSASAFASMSASGKYYLTKDITISTSYANEFSGTLDGNGYSIKIADGANVSPFKKIEGATLKNITFEGVINILKKVTYGGVAEAGYGNFENVIARVGISAMVETSFDSVGVSQGGFIGNVTGATTFINCSNESSVTVVTEKKSASSNISTGVGGFIGSAVLASNGDISFIGCNNNAAILSREPQICVGGFIGVSNNVNLNFTSCNNNAFIFAMSENEGHNGTGGFVGTMVSGVLTVRGCHNIGDIQNDGRTGHAGGLVGRLSSVSTVDIDGFKNLRSVHSTYNGWEGTGGVIGILSDVSRDSVGTYTFKNCMNCGGVRGCIAGGIVGLEQSAHGIYIKFERCLNTSSVTTLGYAYAGGILGRSNGELRGLTFSESLNCGQITASTENSWGVGGICGNIGEDNHTYNFSPVFKNCVNMGNISCKSWSDAVSAAGILSRNIYTPTTITNCVNLGTLSHAKHSSNIVPITTKNDTASHKVSGCSYLSASGTGNPVFGETAKSITNIRADVAAALSSGFEEESAYYNFRNSDSDVNSVGEGIDRILTAENLSQIKQGALAIFDHCRTLVLMNDKKAELIAELNNILSNDNGKYTAESYTAYLTEIEKIMNDINSATNAAEIDAIDLSPRKADAEKLLVLVSDLVNAKKTELLTLLGDKIYNDDGIYTLDSYEAYSDAYLSIKSIIENAKDMSVLEVIDVETLKDAAEAKLVKDTTADPNSSNSDLFGETEETNKVTETEPTVENNKKCGASLSISALVVTCIVGTALIAKKKD